MLGRDSTSRRGMQTKIPGAVTVFEYHSDIGELTLDAMSLRRQHCVVVSWCRRGIAVAVWVAGIARCKVKWLGRGEEDGWRSKRTKRISIYRL